MADTTKAICADGKVRTATRRSGDPLNAFVRIGKHTISGKLYVEDGQERFVANANGRWYNLLTPPVGTENSGITFGQDA